MDSVRAIVCWLGGSAVGLVVLGRYQAGVNPGFGIATLIAAAMMLLPLALGWKQKPLRYLCIMLIAALTGCGRALLVHPTDSTSTLAYYSASGVRAVVTGVIADDPVLADAWQRLHVNAEAIRLSSEKTPHAVSGEMLVLVARYPAYHAGDRLDLTGLLSPPPDIPGFDYRAYLGEHGIYSYMSYPRSRHLGTEAVDSASQTLQSARRLVAAAIQWSVPEPDASLAIGVVIGDRTSIPKDILSEFQTSGTTHVLAVSGENVALVTGFVWLLMKGRQNRRPTILLTGILVSSLVLYTAFTGAAPSIIRATVMCSVLLLAPLVRRRYDPVAALAVSAFGMSALEPRVLLDGGFLLSFSAMLGIVLIAPRIRVGLKRRRCPEFLAVAISTGLAAQIFVLPLGAWLTGRLSIVGLPATLFVDLALLPLMLSSMLTGVLGIIAPPLAAVTGTFVWLCAAWMIWWVGLWAQVPFAAFDIHMRDPAWPAAYYGLVAASVWFAAHERVARLWLHSWRKPALAGLAMAAGLWLALFGLLASRW
jgi:competence protein ComEC